jgi:hypothetical protein
VPYQVRPTHEEISESLGLSREAAVRLIPYFKKKRPLRFKAAAVSWEVAIAKVVFVRYHRNFATSPYSPRERYVIFGAALAERIRDFPLLPNRLASHFGG